VVKFTDLTGVYQCISEPAQSGKNQISVHWVFSPWFTLHTVFRDVTPWVLIVVNFTEENTVSVFKQWRTEGVWGIQTPPEIPKGLQNRAKLNPILKTVKEIAEFRTPTLQDVRKKGRKILKLSRFAIFLH
jgi:hypothetical protein